MDEMRATNGNGEGSVGFFIPNLEDSYIHATSVVSIIHTDALLINTYIYIDIPSRPRPRG